MMPYEMNEQQLKELNEKYAEMANKSYINLSDKYGDNPNLFLVSLDAIQVMERYEKYRQGRERKIVLTEQSDGTYRLNGIKVKIVRGSEVIEAVIANE